MKKLIIFFLLFSTEAMAKCWIQDNGTYQPNKDYQFKDYLETYKSHDESRFNEIKNKKVDFVDYQICEVGNMWCVGDGKSLSCFPAPSKKNPSNN